MNSTSSTPSSVTPNRNSNTSITTTTTTTIMNSNDNSESDEDDVVTFGQHSPLINTPGIDHISRRDTILLNDSNHIKPLLNLFQDSPPSASSSGATPSNFILDETPSPIKNKQLISPLIPLGTPLSWRQENSPHSSISSGSSSSRSSLKKLSPFKRLGNVEGKRFDTISLRSPGSARKVLDRSIEELNVDMLVTEEGIELEEEEVEEEVEEEQYIPETSEEESLFVLALEDAFADEASIILSTPPLEEMISSTSVEVGDSEPIEVFEEIEEVEESEKLLKLESLEIFEEQEESVDVEEAIIQIRVNHVCKVKSGDCNDTEVEKEDEGEEEEEDGRFDGCKDVTMKFFNFGILPEEEQQEDVTIEVEEEVLEEEEVVVSVEEEQESSEEEQEIEIEENLVGDVTIKMSNHNLTYNLPNEVEDVLSSDIDDVINEGVAEEIEKEDAEIFESSDLAQVSNKLDHLDAVESVVHDGSSTTEEEIDALESPSDAGDSSLNASTSSSTPLSSNEEILTTLSTPRAPTSISPSLIPRSPNHSDRLEQVPSPTASTSSLTPSANNDNRTAWAPPITKRQLTKSTSRTAKTPSNETSEPVLSMKARNSPSLVTSKNASSTIRRTSPSVTSSTLNRSIKPTSMSNSIAPKFRSTGDSISSHKARILGANKNAAVPAGGTPSTISHTRKLIIPTSESLPRPASASSSSSSATSTTLSRLKTIPQLSTTLKVQGSSSGSTLSRVSKPSIPITTKRLIPPTISRVTSFGISRSKLPSSTTTIPTTSRIAPPTSSIPSTSSSRFVSATAARATPSIRPPSSTTTTTTTSTNLTRPRLIPTMATSQVQSAPTVLVTVVESPPPLNVTPISIEEEIPIPLPAPVLIAPILPQLPRPLPKAVDSTSSPKRKALRVWEAPEKTVKENMNTLRSLSTFSSSVSGNHNPLQRANYTSALPSSNFTSRPPLHSTQSLTLKPASFLSSPLPIKVTNPILTISAEKSDSSCGQETFGSSKVVVEEEIESHIAEVVVVGSPLETGLLTRPVRKPKPEIESVEVLPVVPIAVIVPLPRPTRKKIIVVPPSPPPPSISESIEEILYSCTPMRPPPTFVVPPSLTSDELTQLTQKNTRKNKAHFNKLDIQTIYMEVNRPPSPTSKIRRSLGKEGNGPTTKEGREARAAKRRSALRSSMDGSAERLLLDELGEMPGEMESEKEEILVHFRAPGDEEEFKSPVKVDRKLKNSKGKKVEDTLLVPVSNKSVKWDKALVYEDGAAAIGDMIKVDGIIKRVPLDSFGNSRSTATGFAKPASVAVTKLIFKDDER